MFYTQGGLVLFYLIPLFSSVCCGYGCKTLKRREGMGGSVYLAWMKALVRFFTWSTITQ